MLCLKAQILSLSVAGVLRQIKAPLLRGWKQSVRVVGKQLNERGDMQGCAPMPALTRTNLLLRSPSKRKPVGTLTKVQTQATASSLLLPSCIT